MSTNADNPSIQWQAWDEKAFSAAEAESKPVLLTLTATWCHWCHVMDQTSYSDRRVIDMVNERFVPVRVDVDQRPDISLRYNQGGFPSIALLDSQARLITGRVYTPPDEMAQLLEQVSSRYAGSADMVETSFDSATVPASSAPADGGPGAMADLVLDKLRELYDADFGGFGLEPKQPPWEALGLLAARYSRSGDKTLLDMVKATLDGMYDGLCDRNDQGFFRYSVSRDWRVPHYEKMLYTNASLAAAYLDAAQLTGRQTYRKAAVSALDYMLSTLYDEKAGLFYASQDAGEEYYRLPWKDRHPHIQPAIDRTFYTGWNAATASSLLKGFAVLGADRYIRAATQVLDLIWDEANAASGGLRHTVRGRNDGPEYLADHVHALRAYLELYQVDANPDALRKAESLVAQVQESFSDDGGEGFYDTAYRQSTPGVVLPREKPLLENSLLAEALVKLSYLVDDHRYQQLARDTLAAFDGVAPNGTYLGPAGSRRMERDEERLFLPAGSAWARAWDAVDQGPVHEVIVGRSSDSRTKRLLTATLRAHAPHKVVQCLDPGQDMDRIEALGFPAGETPTLYICMGGMCLAPIANPSEVRQVAATRPWASVPQLTTWNF